MSNPVKVLFFASLREEVGVAEVQVDARNPAELITALRAKLGAEAVQPLEQENVRIAVNQVLVQQDVVFAAGDEVAFLPPVTGG